MVLVGTDAVRASLGGINQLVECPIVILANACGIRQFVPRRGNPDRLVTLLEIVGQFSMRHEMKRRDLHGTFLPIALSSKDSTQRGSSICHGLLALIEHRAEAEKPVNRPGIALECDGDSRLL